MIYCKTITNKLKDKVFMANLHDDLTLVIQSSEDNSISKRFFAYKGLNVSEHTKELDLLFTMRDAINDKSVVISVDFDTCRFNSISFSNQLEKYLGDFDYEIIDLIHYVYMPIAENYECYHLDNFRDYVSVNGNVSMLNLVDNNYYDWVSLNFPGVDINYEGMMYTHTTRIGLIRHYFDKYWLVKLREDGTKLINFS